jgi:hypothetical protein
MPSPLICILLLFQWNLILTQLFNWIWLNSIGIQFKSCCIAMLFTPQFHITINWFPSFQKNQFFSYPIKIFVFFLFFNVFSLGTKEKDLLHVTHFILSLLPFGQNSFISRLF